MSKTPQSAVAAEPHVGTDGHTRHVPIDRRDSQELGPELIVPSAHGRQSISGRAQPPTAPPAWRPHTVEQLRTLWSVRRGLLPDAGLCRAPMSARGIPVGTLVPDV